ncbi:MAG: zinc metallopeptidase [Gammaproteobacteria bacterium]|nr:peptidase [Gammaproteobacteria bacterium]
MHLLLLLIVLGLLVIAGPSLWVQSVMKRYSVPGNRYPRTGGEVARALLDAAALRHVRTEITDRGDHYDPIEKVVRLSRANFEGRSLTAVTIAAHEVGHALQDASGFAPLAWRTRLVRWIQPIERIGAGMMMFAPFGIGLLRKPAIGLLAFAGGLLTLASAVLVHLLTLPTELDASFGRALPLLERHGLLRDEDRPRARRLLTAAALTYVAAALQSLLHVGRWWSILRRP